MRRPLIHFFLALAGFTALLAGLSAALTYAPRLALLRQLLLGAGGLVLAGWAIRLLDQSGRVPQPLRAGIQSAWRGLARLVNWLIFSPRLGLTTAGLVLALTSLFAVWYASLGLFPAFPQVGNLYIDQAEAFLHGQTALLETPSPEILALPDPYTFQTRKGLPYLWDASLFHGKYYLYWGPAPALILAGLMAFGGTAPDPLLVTLASIGSAAIMFWLLWQIRKCHYPQAPVLSIGLFLLITTLNLPNLFLLGRGRVYETSIITGQCFLLLGLAGYFAYTQNNKPGGLFLAGLGWGLAIACRYNLALSVGIFLAFILWRLWNPLTRWSDAAKRGLAMRKTVALLAPLVLCLLGLGLFNTLRFGSPFETGLNYQLTAPVYHNQHFSLAYLRTSFYLNVFYPYRKVDDFPLIRSIAVVPAQAPDWVRYHSGKQVDETVFSLRLVPAFWLLMLLPLAVSLAWRERHLRSQASPPGSSAAARPLVTGSADAWPALAWMVGLAGLLQFGVLLLYYYSAVRFMADYSLSFLLVTVILVWSLDQRLARLPWIRIALWAAVMLSVWLTAVLGFLAGFDNPPQVFHIYNPALEAQIAAAWNGMFTDPGLFGKLLRYLIVPFL